MTWWIDTPSIVPTKAGAIDAACLYSDYGQGMICIGVIYAGVNTLQAQKWALWVSKDQKIDWNSSKALQGTNDADNWFTTATKYDGIWSAYRWMPKTQLQVEWYKGFYRFSSRDTDLKVFLYQSKDTVEYKLVEYKSTIMLMKAQSLIVCGAALALATLLAF